MKTYIWTTPKGSSVELVVEIEHITAKTVDADGFKVNVECDEWNRKIVNCMVNGKQTEMMKFWREKGVNCILIGKRGNNRMLIALPDIVDNDIYGEEREILLKKSIREQESEKIYCEHREMMRRTVGY